jgi:hypothetical protein
VTAQQALVQALFGGMNRIGSGQNLFTCGWRRLQFQFGKGIAAGIRSAQDRPDGQSRCNYEQSANSNASEDSNRFPWYGRDHRRLPAPVWTAVGDFGNPRWWMAVLAQRLLVPVRGRWSGCGSLDWRVALFQSAARGPASTAMRISDSLKTKKAEEAFSAALVVIVLLILPALGGVAMLIGSAIGLVAYAALYGRRHYERGGFRAIFPVLLALVLGAAIAFVLSRGH